MADLRSLKRKIELVAANDNFTLQTQGMAMLVNGVRDFVKQIAEQEAAIKQIPELEHLAHKKAESKEEEKEIGEAKRALQTALDLKKSIARKKTALRQLGSEVSSLLKEMESHYR
jgi:hypothetical protein